MVLLEDASFGRRWGRLPCCSYFSTLASGLVYFAILLGDIILLWHREAPAQGRTSLTWSILTCLVFVILELGDLVTGRKGEMAAG